MLQSKGYEISYIFTHKDLSDSGVDTFAKSHKIPFYYKDLRKNKDFIGDKESDQVILVSINYRYILEKNIFNKFLYAINIHGSLLPKYRGRTPHVWAIINGEKYAGITSHLIDEGVDTGAIIKQEKIKIEEHDTGAILLQRYEKIYPNLLIDSIDFLLNNGVPSKQNEEHASYFGKREPIMGYIDFYQKSDKIIDFVRAQSNPYPGAYSYLQNGQKIIIHKIEKTKDIQYIETIGAIKSIEEKYFVKSEDGYLKVIDFEIK
jgi:methionyl-tRNA formyltransferase